MKYKLTVLLVFLGILHLQAQNAGQNPRVIKADKMDKSRTLLEIAKDFTPNPIPGPPRIMPQGPSIILGQDNVGESTFIDPAWQSWQGSSNKAVKAFQSFDGLSAQDNRDLFGTTFAPPDPDMDVGPNHVVQMVNILFAIWDKQGNQLMSPLPINALWQGFGGPCEIDNDGDPIVLYDPLADRWILTQFAVSTGDCECVAVSETGDPTGAYFRYKFSIGGFPDYPKLGVWPDGYYVTFRQFGVGPNVQVLAGAFEREKMIAGDSTAQMVMFNISQVLGPSEDFFHAIPADLDGPPPPQGTPGYFIGWQDAQVMNGVPQDRLALFDLSPDWSNPANSVFNGPFYLPTDPFDVNLCGFGRDCLPQMGTTNGLDALSNKMMYRLTYRNFGAYQAMVTNHTVDVGDFQDHAGIRWYELRNFLGNWIIHQEGTYAPDDNHRFMGSIGIDSTGNIGMSYSVTGPDMYPAIRYTGRLANSPLGEMSVTEQSLIEGTGSQTNPNRWGDYTRITIDPSDDATFWMTNEYYATTSGFNWKTRIGSFKFEDFKAPNAHREFVAYSDFSTPNSMELNWINPTTLQNGEPLSTDEYRTFIVRDSVVIDSLDGGIDQFVDSGLVDGTEYHYTIFAEDTASQLTSDPVEASWIAGGAPTPNPPIDFTIAGNQDEVVLHWVNPLTNVDGTPMDDFTGINLYQDSVLVSTFTRIPADTGRADSLMYAPAIPGIYSWHLTAIDNETPQNESEITKRLVTPLNIDLLDPFSGLGIPKANLWITENATIDDRALDPPSGPTALNLNGTGRPTGGDEITLRPVNLAGLEGSGVVFSYFYQPEGNGDPLEPRDSLRVFLRNDQGNWIKIRGYDASPVMPFQHEIIDLNTEPNGGGSYFHDQFQVRFSAKVSPHPLVPRDDWFVDNLYLGIPAPAFDISQDTIFFDTTAVNQTSIVELEVQNIGLMPFSVSDISVTGDVFAVDTTNFTIEGSTHQGVNISFSPSALTDFEGRLQIVHNAPNTGTAEVVLLGTGSPVVGIADGSQVPLRFDISSNYPNPFNPTTTIKYQLPHQSEVKLAIYNLLGQEVRTLVNGVVSAGYHEILWDAQDETGKSVSSGLYIYRFQATSSGKASFEKVHKMILLK